MFNKGQLSYIIKPMTLVITIVLLVFLLQTLYTNKVRERTVEKNLDIVSTATNILLILANSEECLAYDDSLIITKANILDIEKIESFNSNYQDIEPECARNYDFGWRVKIEQINKNNIVERKWEFGADSFSDDKLVKNQVEFWIPVAIRYSENDVRLGKMNIKLVDGELEKLAGFFDWSCKMGKMNRMSSLTTEIMISQPATYENGKLCFGQYCRKLLCELIYFDGLDSEGTHELTVNYQEPNKLLVSK